MGMKNIEMLQEQIDAILIAELQESLEIALDWGENGQFEPNFELIHALKTCLAYYMVKDDFDAYAASLVKRQEKAARKKK